MPKPLVFAACEKVIIAQEENNPTLIALLSEMGGSIEVTEQPPGLIAAPVRWQIFTLWAKEPVDDEKEFEQTVRFVSPSGKNHLALPGGDPTLPVFFKGKTHRVSITITTMPIGENGKWTLQLFIREKGTKDWPDEPLMTYPLHLNFTVEVKPIEVKPVD